MCREKIVLSLYQGKISRYQKSFLWEIVCVDLIESRVTENTLMYSNIKSFYINNSFIVQNISVT